MYMIISLCFNILVKMKTECTNICELVIRGQVYRVVFYQLIVFIGFHEC